MSSFASSSLTLPVIRLASFLYSSTKSLSAIRLSLLYPPLPVELFLDEVAMTVSAASIARAAFFSNSFFSLSMVAIWLFCSWYRFCSELAYCLRSVVSVRSSVVSYFRLWTWFRKPSLSLCRPLITTFKRASCSCSSRSNLFFNVCSTFLCLLSCFCTCWSLMLRSSYSSLRTYLAFLPFIWLIRFVSTTSSSSFCFSLVSSSVLWCKVSCLLCSDSFKSAVKFTASSCACLCSAKVI